MTLDRLLQRAQASLPEADRTVRRRYRAALQAPPPAGPRPASGLRGIGERGRSACCGPGPRGDELSVQRQAEDAALSCGEEGFHRSLEVAERIDVRAVIRADLEWKCGSPSASPESPFQAICWPAVTFAPLGTANDTSLTHPPLLSFLAVRSLFKWMYRYVVPLDRRDRACSRRARTPSTSSCRPPLPRPAPATDSQVDSRVRPVGARVAIVVPDVRLRNEREDEAWHRAASRDRSPGSPRQRRSGRREEGGVLSSGGVAYGCAPVRSSAGP